MSLELEECPRCFELIEIDSKYCKYCGFELIKEKTPIKIVEHMEKLLNELNDVANGKK